MLKGTQKMGKIMELFCGEFGSFQAEMVDSKWSVEFHDEVYPPRIIIDQMIPPLFEMTDDGQKTDSQAGIQIIGTPDLRVTITGELRIGKKELNKYINTDEKLLQLYLHGFMQDKKEIEDVDGR